MQELITHIDSSWLLLINGAYTPWLDTIMWYASQTLTWLPLYLLIAYSLWRNDRTNWKSFLITLLIIALGILCCDQLCHLLKYAIARPRPSHTPGLEDMLHYVRNYQGGRFGFPSSHAANTVFLATFYTLYTLDFRLRKRLTSAILPIIWLYALINCYSRMYLGVHYPTDILMGTIIGLSIAGLAQITFRKIQTRLCTQKIQK